MLYCDRWEVIRLKQYGDPLFAVRMPGAVITGLKLLAKQRGVTASDVVRELVVEELKANGIRTIDEPLPGQMTVE